MASKITRNNSRHWAIHLPCRTWLVVACILCFLSPASIVEASTNPNTGPSSPAFVHPSTTATTTREDAVLVDTNTTSDGGSNNDTTNIDIPEWKQRLPAPLNNKTKTLQRLIIPGPQNKVVEVYLLGTAHVSTDSSRDVRLLLETIDPNVIFLEICDGRVGMLVSPPPPPEAKPEPDGEIIMMNSTEIIEKKGGRFLKLFRRRRRCNSEKQQESSSDSSETPAPAARPKKSMYSAAASLLTNMQQDYASSLGVELGGEFRVAYNYWEEHRKYRRLHMILGDRPLYLTLTRAWESLRLWGKTKLIIGLLISSFQKPSPEELKAWMESILSDDSGDLLTESIAELAKHFPTLEEVIIKERDAYMACKLYQTCRELLTASNSRPHHKMVAIVGAGHVEGMCRWLTKPPAPGETPEQVLSRLIQIKKGIPEEDSRYLANDVMELNPELLKEMVEAGQ